MRTTILFVAPLAASALAAANSIAQEPPAAAPVPPAQPAPPPPVKLTLDLGFMNSAGNTDVTTLSLGNELTYKAGRWEIKEIGSGVYGRTGDSVTAEQIKTGARLDVKLVSIIHLFVGVTYERNRFAGISRRFEEVVSLGVRLIDLPTTQWSLETGSSINQQESTTRVSRGFAAVRVATVFRHNFTQSAYFQESAEYLPNVETRADWRVNSESAIIAPVAGRVALKFSYVVKFDNLPEPGFQKSDRVLTTAVQIVL